MTFFSKFTKSSTNNEKTVYPWSQRKISGSHNALPRFGHGATIFDNQHFYIYGGVHTKGNSKKNLFIIDTNNMSTSSVSTSGDIPSPRSFATICSLGPFVLLYGGEPLIPGDIWDPYFYVLHTNTRQWSRVRTKGKLPSERSGHSTCLSNEGIMYVWGGHYQRKYLNDLCAFNVKDYPAKAEWEFIAYENQGPSPRSGHISVLFENKLYIFGGINATHLYNDIWCFDLKSHEWSHIAAVGYIPPPRESCSAVLVDDTIYIFGGKGLNGQCLGDLCAFRIKSQRWYMFQSMGVPPSPRYGFTMTVIQNKIYVFGGDSMGGKVEDTNQVFILDCSKIRYPPEQEHEVIERGSNTNNSLDSQENNIPPQPLNMNYSPSTDQLINHYQHINEDEKLHSPVKINYIDKNLPNHPSTAPPRPPREGVTLTNFSPPRHQRDNSIEQPPPVIPSIPKAATERVQESDEKKNLRKELLARDTIITEMKKKEQWWRTEVSLARQQHVSDNQETNEIKSAHLMSFNLQEPDKSLLFEQLVSVKTEMKKIRNSIQKQTEPILQKLQDAENVRTIALQEAAYYKSKYVALKTRDTETLDLLESDRVSLLEQRLAEAYEEKERIGHTLESVRQQSQQDKEARLLAEERARDSQLQSEEAQEAHQAALDQLTGLYDRIVKAEAKGRQDAILIADLSNELAKCLSSSVASMHEEQDMSHLHIEMSRLEVANIKLRNEIASLHTTLEQKKDDENQLKMALNEKDQAYAEIALELEKACIELELLKNLSSNNNIDATVVRPTGS